jgi:hypothetical protein
MRCAACGKKNADRYKFCLGCGEELLAPQPARPAEPSRADQLAELMTQADDFERFGMFEEAIGCLQRALATSSDRSSLEARISSLWFRVRGGR